jgi:DNA (cytosine-5)-methyltransferase 1
MRGDPAPSREAGQGVAGAIAAGAGKRGDLGPDGCNAGHLTPDVAHSLRAEGFDASEDGTGRGTPLVPDLADPISANEARTYSHAGNNPRLRNCVAYGGNNTRGPIDVATAVNAHGGPHGRLDFESETFVAFTASEEHTYANATKARSTEALRALREALGEEAFCEWAIRGLAGFYEEEVLQQALHGCGLRYPAWSRDWLVDVALSRPEARAQGAVQSVRETGRERCSPSRWKPSEQLAGELGAYLSELSQPGASRARVLRDLRAADEGSRLLQQALSALEEVGRPDVGQGQPEHTTSGVRRLVPAECEILMGLPRGYTAVEYRGKPMADGPRYRCLGNSIVETVLAWLFRRIEAVS